MSKKENSYIVENEKIFIKRDIEGNRILDIGGGGEGVIGACYGERVIAIDRRKDELEEAAEGPLKIVMDAANLGFLDESFDAVTSFFTMMFISKEDHKKVFSEIYRVLKNGREFTLWDALIPKGNDAQDIFMIELNIDIEGKVIKPSYGTLRRNHEQSCEYFETLGKKVGFRIISEEKNSKTFKIVFKKG